MSVHKFNTGTLSLLVANGGDFALISSVCSPLLSSSLSSSSCLALAAAVAATATVKQENYYR